MKYISLFLIVAIVFTVLGGVVYAQEPTAEPTPIINPDNPPTMPEIPTEVPATATEAVNTVIMMVAALWAAFAGMVGYSIVDALKKVKWFNADQRQRIGSGVTRLLIMAFNVLVGVGADFLLKAAVNLDNTGLWAAIATIITVIGVPVAAQLWYVIGKKPVEQVA